MDDLRPWRILLIDDDEDDYYLTKAMLADAVSRKFELVWASKYEEACRLIANGNFDAALVDYDLGARTGIELIKEVTVLGSRIPLILYTGRGSYQVDVEAMQAGATLYLTKREANPLLLERFIRYAIERRQAEETLRESRDRLEQRVAERTQDLAEINQMLETRVVERTIELELVNRRLEAVLQTQPVAVWIADASGRIIHANPMTEVVWGGKAPLSENVEGYSEYRGWWSDTGEELKAADWGLARALKGETSVGDVIDIARFDGKQGTIINSAAPIYDSDRQFLGAVAVAQDITHQRILEQQALESADRAEWQAEELKAAILEKESAEKELRENQVRLEMVIARLQEERAVKEQLALEKHRRVEELDAVFDAISDTVIVYDSEGLPTRVNKAVIQTHGVDFTGYPREDIAKMLNVMRPDGTPVTFEELPSSRAMRGEIVRGEHLHYIDKDGEQVHVQANANPLYGPDLRQIGAVVIWHNVTGLEKYAREQKRLMEQNRYQRKLLEHMMEVLPVGVCILRGDDYQVEYANSVFLSLLGGDISSIQSQKYQQLLPQLFEGAGKDLLDDLFRDGEHPVQRELKITTGAGGAERYWALSHVVIPGYENEVEGILVLATDLTEQILARKQVETERDKLTALLESLEDEVWLADREGNVQLLNPAAVNHLGVENVDELLGPLGDSALRKLEILNPDGNERKDEETPLLRSLKGETIRGEEIVRHLKTGQLMHRQYVCGPILDESEQVIGAVAVVRDITERKRLDAALLQYAEDLRHSNQELEQFAFTASHDLQEPLRKIETFSGILRTRLAETLEAKDRDYLERMHNAAMRMRKMIADLLALSRVTSQGKPPVQVDLNKTARAVMSDLEILVKNVGAQVELGELPQIEADPMQMQRLFQNLVENALKFRRKDVEPELRIGYRSLSPGSVEIYFQDNGIGFDIRYFKQALQPFKRLHSRSEYEGSGMGLAICHRIVERHGGAITATSIVGEGSTFTVTLPLHPPTSSIFSRNLSP